MGTETGTGGGRSYLLEKHLARYSSNKRKTYVYCCRLSGLEYSRTGRGGGGGGIGLATTDRWRLERSSAGRDIGRGGGGGGLSNR